jgi:hypothetical protein
MHIDPDLRKIFSRSIFLSDISKNPSEVELRCLSLNHHACNILVKPLSRDATMVSPFQLVYGHEAILLVEISLDVIRFARQNDLIMETIMI